MTSDPLISQSAHSQKSPKSLTSEMLQFLQEEIPMKELNSDLETSNGEDSDSDEEESLNYFVTENAVKMRITNCL